MSEKIYTSYKALPPHIDYNIHVKPILSDKCFTCHGPDKDKVAAGLQLHNKASAFSELLESPNTFAITPGNLKKSEVFNRILSKDPEQVMPPSDSHLTLSSQEKATLIKWIEDGAQYKDHWAFIAPEKVEIPKIQESVFLNNPIDNFVIQKLQSHNLKPSKKASKEVLLRRVSLDLTGLPPTKEEVLNFLSNTAPDAYEKEVDRLLNSNHYGEKMAMDWLDVARYADTHGYFVDRYRDMSPWRDWVINSFNQNMPYDQFITWQLAGDLLENPTKDQILATGFNRLHPQNLEGGIIDEEFRIAYVADRTDVVGQGLMGLTVACAKCHDHKYDSFSQKNYFELFSFFNQVNESGQIPWDWSMPVPTMLLPTEQEQKMITYINALVSEKEHEVNTIKSNQKAAANHWIARQLYKTDPFKDPNHYIAYYDFETPALRNRLYPNQRGKMKTQFANNQKIILKKGYKGKGLQFDGDAWLDLDKIGIFQRSEPFSIAISVYIPKDLKEGVIFHKGQGTRLHSYRGYHLSITKENTFELLMAHVLPDKDIVKTTINKVPRNKWIQLTLTYDGSSKANGIKLYMNGKLQNTKVHTDNLYKDIIFHDLEDYIYPDPIEPGLQIGARWRGKGIAGAIADELMVFNKELSFMEVLKIASSKKTEALARKKPSEISDQEKKHLIDYYLSTKSKSVRRAVQQLTKVRTLYADSIDPIKEVMVMKDTPGLRKTFVLERGQYDAPTEEVFSNTPKSLPSMKKNYPKID